MTAQRRLGSVTACSRIASDGPAVSRRSCSQTKSPSSIFFQSAQSPRICACVGRDTGPSRHEQFKTSCAAFVESPTARQEESAAKTETGERQARRHRAAAVEGRGAAGPRHRKPSHADGSGACRARTRHAHDGSAGENFGRTFSARRREAAKARRKKRTFIDADCAGAK